MKSSTIFALVGISVCMLIIGTTLGSITSRTPSNSTKTVTITSQNTVVEIVTRVSTVSAPSKIAINGTVDSEYYYPVDVDFCVLQNELTVVNATETTSGIVTTCGLYSAPVQNISHSTETFGGSNQTFDYYHGTYSFVLPNNETYFILMNLHNLSSLSYSQQDVGWLPLNYTSSAEIVNFDISCYYLQGNLNLSFQCNSVF